MGFFQGPQASGAFEIHAANTTLKVVGRAIMREALLDKPKESDLLAAFAPEAPLALRIALTPKAMADPAGPAATALGFLVANACRGCDATVTKGLLDSIRPQLTGSVGLVVKGLDPTAATEKLSRYFLVSHAYLLPVKDEQLARKALEAGIEKLKAKGVAIAPVEMSEGAQWSVPLGGRDARLGVAHGALFVANDSGARALALTTLAAVKPGKDEHAASLRVEGPLATAALRRISVMDVTKSQELAALFAFGVETGTLRKAAGTIEGFAEPEAGGIHFEAGFALKPSK